SRSSPLPFMPRRMDLRWACVSAAHSPHGRSNACARRDGVGAVRRTARAFSRVPQHSVRRTLHIRAHQISDCARRPLVRRPACGHGYPLSEQNLMSIMREVTYLAPHVEEVNTLAFDDPALFRYPIAYVIEPDWWSMTESEAVAMRTYMQKGGFIIVDDFKPM